MIVVVVLGLVLAVVVWRRIRRRSTRGSALASVITVAPTVRSLHSLRRETL